MKKVIVIGTMAVLMAMNGVALYSIQQLKAEITYQRQLLDTQEKYIKAEMYRVNAAFYLIASPAFQNRTVREKLQVDMERECEKYKETTQEK